MKARHLTAKLKTNPDRDVFSNKSGLVLHWLLTEGLKRPEFGVREVAGDLPVSLGLVQGVFETLVDQGFLSVSGIRTAKTFSWKDPKRLLESWCLHYDISKKCRMWTYRTSLEGRKKVLNVLRHSDHWQKVAVALHTAADSLGFKFSNLDTTELYILDPDARQDIEELLQLEPQERGYEVLLIQPYYKALLQHLPAFKRDDARFGKAQSEHLYIAPKLLTYLDLYNFPVRGREQAEAMAEKDVALRQILSSRRRSK